MKKIIDFIESNSQANRFQMIKKIKSLLHKLNIWHLFNIGFLVRGANEKEKMNEVKNYY